MDVARTCFIQSVRFWQDASAPVLIRWYRVPEDAPDMTIPPGLGWQSGGRPLIHRFSMAQNWDDQPAPDPLDGQAGVFPYATEYDKGALPMLYRPNGHYTGSVRAWQDGGVRGLDPPLTWTPYGSSEECLVALGITVGSVRGALRTTAAVRAIGTQFGLCRAALHVVGLVGLRGQQFGLIRPALRISAGVSARGVQRGLIRTALRIVAGITARGTQVGKLRHALRIAAQIAARGSQLGQLRHALRTVALVGARGVQPGLIRPALRISGTVEVGSLTAGALGYALRIDGTVTAGCVVEDSLQPALRINATVSNGSGGPTPGADCSSAGAFTPGSPVSDTVPTFVTHWFKVPSLASGTWHFSMTADSSGALFWQVFTGICSSKTQQLSGHGVGCASGTFGGSGDCLIAINNFGSSATYSFTFASGPCP